MLGDLEDAVLQALDVVGRLDYVVKLEDPDGGMGLAIGHDGEFKKALTTAYVAQSIESRYDLCLSVLLLLLFIALDSPDTLKSSIAAARACVAFHALGLLRSLTKQSAGDLAGVSGGYGDVEDDVLARFEAMGFASPAPGAIGVGRSGPQYSLVHSLLPRANLSASVLQSAHGFIREAGVLSDTALLDAGPGTVGLVERLRSLGYLDFSRELAMRLPPTPGVCYVHARLLMDLGRPDEAAVLFEKVANNFGRLSFLPLFATP
jgi:nuclear pore complex protein Nup160